MDWIETTGKSIDEAKEAALDELGVDEQDAEFEVVAEPKTGLFGRMRVEARVRSRVRPTAPRPKDDRRGRRRAKPTGTNAEGANADGADDEAIVPASAAQSGDNTLDRPSGASTEKPAPAVSGRDGSVRPTVDVGAVGTLEAPPDGVSGDTGARGRRNGRSAASDRKGGRDQVSDVEVPLEEQGAAARDFILGLLREFGVSAEVTATVGEDDVVDLSVTGDDLGMLIGPKGSTLVAMQDLTRSAVQQKTNAGNGRIHVDVSGYRQKRSEALARFALQVAETVKGSGASQALEPMSAVDRKVVHDTLTDVDGVSTVSEGEDADRRVVVLPSA